MLFVLNGNDDGHIWVKSIIETISAAHACEEGGSVGSTQGMKTRGDVGTRDKIVVVVFKPPGRVGYAVRQWNQECRVGGGERGNSDTPCIPAES